MGKLDHGMRGPYPVVRVLPHWRYELRLVAGSYGKTAFAAAQYIGKRVYTRVVCWFVRG